MNLETKVILIICFIMLGILLTLSIGLYIDLRNCMKDLDQSEKENYTFRKRLDKSDKKKIS